MVICYLSLPGVLLIGVSLPSRELQDVDGRDPVLSGPGNNINLV